MKAEYLHSLVRVKHMMMRCMCDTRRETKWGIQSEDLYSLLGIQSVAWFSETSQIEMVSSI